MNTTEINSTPTHPEILRRLSLIERHAHKETLAILTQEIREMYDDGIMNALMIECYCDQLDKLIKKLKRSPRR